MVAMIMTLATFVGNKRKTEPKQLPSFESHTCVYPGTIDTGQNRNVIQHVSPG